jgi:predicted ribosomally synthesized peptide with nif11-like leader
MSIENAKAFLERVINDEDFRQSVGEIATAEERMNFVKVAGFDFTKEEIKSEKFEHCGEDSDALWGYGGGMGIRIPCESCAICHPRDGRTF